MNLNNIIDEIGIFETYKKIENNIYNDSLLFNISKYIPISSDNFKLQSVNDVTNKIINLQKRNVMFLSNEISILEELLKYKNCFDNIIVVLSNSLSKKQKENIVKNSPSNNLIKYIDEMNFPTLIKPKNSVLISFGFINGNKCLLSNKSYRTLEIYKDFLGEKVFIPCLNENIGKRPCNWILLNINKYFTKVF